MLRNMAIAQKLGSVMITGLMVFSAGAAVAAAPASASSCSSHLDVADAPFAPDPHRAGASCSDLSSNHKARAKLDRNNTVDVYSVWFSTENTTRYTVWRTCLTGCDDDYQVSRR